ncbi:MAG: integrase core domain-containing protein [Akkermansiaceae bacterium]
MSFAKLNEVREIFRDWIISYNEKRTHASLVNLPPIIHTQQLT